MSTDARKELVFYLNKERVAIPAGEVDPQMTLATFIRDRGLTGTKIGCSEGGCGACTLLLSYWAPAEGRVVHVPAAGCLVPLAYVDHMLVTTIEGLSKDISEQTLRRRDLATQPNALQEQLARKHATQCGFCTPGIVMALAGVGARNPKPTMHDIEDALDGNLCRCTGYRPILEAAHAMAVDYDPALDGKLSKETGLGKFCAGDFLEDVLVLPDELKQPAPVLDLVTPTSAWFRPNTLEELLRIKATGVTAKDLPANTPFSTAADDAFAPARLISGNTEIGYKIRYHPPTKPTYFTFVSTAAVPELHKIEYTPEGIFVGSAVTIAGLIDALAACPAKDENKRAAFAFKAVTKVLSHFANTQVRNMGTVGGSLVTCDPLSDLYSPLVALNASVNLVAHKGGKRTMKVDEFALAANKSALEQDEAILNVFIPYPKENEFFDCYKEAKRREDAQAVVNAAFRVVLEGPEHIVKDITVAYGAVSNRAAKRFTETEQAILGKPFTENTIHDAARVARAECAKLIEKRRGMIAYRETVVPSLLMRFYVSAALQAGIPVPAALAKTASDELAERVHVGNQDYNAPWSQEENLGRPMAHLAANQHVTGTATFVADEAFSGYYAAFAFAKRAHAKILSLDTEKAKAMPGVVAVLTHKDVPGSNWIGSILPDEELLVSEEVQMYEQPIAIVVAKTAAQARTAARFVTAEYEDLPVILEIEEAIAANSFYHEEFRLESGNVEEIFAKYPESQVISGEVRIGGQEHFYIEPQASTCWPSADKFVVHTTTQNPSKVQQTVADVLGKPFHFVESSMERLGGGFGGKQDRPIVIASAVAVAAYNVNAPVRMVYERDEDMRITGQRHEFLVRYRVAHEPDGKIVAMQADLFNNGGYSWDLSGSVMEVAMFAIDNCYSIPNTKLHGRSCKTNRISCTAYRGFGKPQGVAAMENIIDHVAHNCGVPPVEVRNKNLYQTGEKLIDEEWVDECLHKAWDPLYERYQARRAEVDKFNAENRYKKRGLTLCPAKNNMGFETVFMNQGGALVNIYRDGSVLVSHGGTEMGQGLHTKMVQCAADELGCPMDRVSVARSGSERVPNTHPTAACTGTELNAGAVIDACKQLSERLKPIREKLGPDADWKKICWEAYAQRISLGATGHYSLPIYNYSWKTKEGRSSFYRIWGAALTEVELDVLSGMWRIVKTDIIQDNGSGLNPAIDIGQVEGGFVQGTGLYMLEELIWARDGHLRTRNVSTYKIPAHDDIPLEFNVELIKGVTNERAVKGNKTVGEAGLQLGISVAHAVKDAIYAVRRDYLPPEEAGKFFRLDTPCTVEKIRLACPTPFNQ